MADGLSCRFKALGSESPVFITAAFIASPHSTVLGIFHLRDRYSQSTYSRLGTVLELNV